MSLAVVTTVAVLDRTGAVQDAIGDVDVPVFDVEHPSELDADRLDVDVLVLGARELSAIGLHRVARWRRHHPASIAVAHLDGLPVDRALLRAAGIEHAMRGRMTRAKLHTALARADERLAELLEATGRWHPHAVPSPTEPMDDVEFYEDEYDDDEQYDEDFNDDLDDDTEASTSTSVRAKVITVASATGGCGKTFFATTVASLLARRQLRVLVLDLDLQFGEVAAALQVQHPYSLYDGLYTTNGERLPASAMEEHLDELVHHHPLGFDVLCAPRDPVLADYVRTRDARVILDAVTRHYDVVVTDTPPALNDVVITALDRSDLVYVLATLDVPSLRNLNAFMDVISRLGLRDERTRLVLNKAQSDVGVTVEQANEAFDGRFRSVLPSDRAVSRAVNLGTTVAIHEPRARVSRAIVPIVTGLAEELGLADAAEAPVEAATYDLPKPRLLTRLWRRLLPGGTT